MKATKRELSRPTRLLTRTVPIAVLATAAFAVGLLIGRGSAETEAAKRFVAAWIAQDFAAMYEELSPAAAAEFPAKEFRTTYLDAQDAATITGIGVPGEIGSDDSGDTVVAAVPVVFSTAAFKRLDGTLEIPISDDGIEWAPNLVYPGLSAEERLGFEGSSVPERAAILAADGTPLAAKGDRSSPLGTAAADVVGELGQADADAAAKLERRGFPADTPVGVTGIELAFDDRLAGIPGGKLIATNTEGGKARLLARSKAVEARPLETTIDPTLQSAAVTALGDRLGGVAVLDARSGEVRAVAGLAFSAPQPPGSTFKIITASAGLAEKKVKPSDEFAAVTSIDAGGRELSNAHDELCGGTFVEAFARSCNTVFAPLGVELGAETLLDYSEAFGFNQPPTLYNEEAIEAVGLPSSTIPDPIESPVEVAVSAIGQGRVLATPLQIASLAQVIAAKGVRMPTAITREPALQPDFKRRRVIEPAIAAEIKKMMVEVVKSGTGTAGALESTQVAAKTGTAELQPKQPEPGDPPLAEGEDPELEVDAWFSAFAPADKPKLAVGVMIVNADGDGGVVAAPIARQVLAAALGP